MRDLLVDLVRRYQDYDPATGRFDYPRPASEYAALLGIHQMTLYSFYRGKFRRSYAIMKGFTRAFPHVAEEATALFRKVA